MTEIDYEARVAKGIALLDETYPDWVKTIDVERLDIRSGRSCVTAQLAQYYQGRDANHEDGMEMLHLTYDDDATGSYTEHGFNAESWSAPGMPEEYSQDEVYCTLTAIWEREITARQSAGDA